MKRLITIEELEQIKEQLAFHNTGDIWIHRTIDKLIGNLEHIFEVQPDELKLAETQFKLDSLKYFYRQLLKRMEEYENQVKCLSDDMKFEIEEYQEVLEIQ